MSKRYNYTSERLYSTKNKVLKADQAPPTAPVAEEREEATKTTKSAKKEREAKQGEETTLRTKSKNPTN